MIILLNHTDKVQETNIISKNVIRLKNKKNKVELGKGMEFNVKLKPAEVMFLDVE
jgi:hypothetical protein